MPFSGSVPPHTYGRPRYFCASATTAAPVTVLPPTAATGPAWSPPGEVTSDSVWAKSTPEVLRPTGCSRASCCWIWAIREVTSEMLTRHHRSRGNAATAG
jgi:hypothetical protein